MHYLYRLTSYSPWGLLLLRLSVGSIFLFHGIQKWALWSVLPSPQMPANMLSLMKFLSIVEPLGGLALILGFLTSLASLGLGIIMLGAIWFKVKIWQIGFTAQNTTGWEFDLILLAANVALLFGGAGKWALDKWVWRKE